MDSPVDRTRLGVRAGGVVLIAAGLLIDSAAAIDTTSVERVELERRIAQLRADLEARSSEQDAHHQQVELLERQMVAVERRRRDLAEQLHDASAEQTRLARQREELGERVAAQRRRLAALVRAAFLAGREGHLRILLNGGDPARLGRMLTYARLVADARAERLRELEQGAEKLVDVDARLAGQRAALGELSRRLDGEQEALERARRGRTALLRDLTRRVDDRRRELERLREDARRLTHFARGLQRSTRGADEPAPRQSPLGVDFDTLRGTLRLPVRAAVRARYGQAKAGEGLFWDGLLLSAPEGTPVEAVYRGRVAYADWLRGFGLLLILDHGGGYMSLYGHNAVLHKELGDWVETGEVIAGVGSTGGLAEAGLYFEIRHQGETRDPLVWCRRD